MSTSIRQEWLLPLSLFVLVAMGAMSMSAAAKSKEPSIVCFGDSITAGYGVDPGHSYPDYLRALLESRGYHYRIINMGVGGNTTKDAVDRLPQVVNAHPAVVIVEFGGNDGLRGLPLSVTQANLDTITGTLLRAGSKVLLAGITLPPNYGATYVHQFDAVYRSVASKYHVPLLPMLYANVYQVRDAVQPDGIHPTAKGARLIAENLLPKLLPMLKKQG